VICAWWGRSAEPPPGWAVCDGTRGMPDLRGRFLLACDSDTEPGAIGGSKSHTHGTQGLVHSHYLAAGDDIAPGSGGFSCGTDPNPPPRSVTPAAHMPPFFALAFIMWIGGED
jgi:hypothetical protein